MDPTRIESPEKTLTRPDSEDTLEPGTVVQHTYQILSLLSQGGMGEVYKARHRVADTLHAVKIIRPDLVNDPKCLALFQREATVIRAIKHDVVVNYDGLLCDKDGRVYLIMEFIEGPTLGQYLKRFGKLKPAELLSLAVRLSEGLAAFHAKGVVHRDLSPENIIIPEHCLEKAKLIDFGIAKQIGAGSKTILGNNFAGKIAYAAPEQLDMIDPTKVDGRADIYSLGMVLLTAANGKRLNRFEANDVLKQLPPEISGILSWMLEQDPSDRPQSATEFIQRIKSINSSITGNDPGQKKSFAKVALLTASVMMLVGISVYFWFQPADLNFGTLSSWIERIGSFGKNFGSTASNGSEAMHPDNIESGEKSEIAIDKATDSRESADSESVQKTDQQSDSMPADTPIVDGTGPPERDNNINTADSDPGSSPIPDQPKYDPGLAEDAGPPVVDSKNVADEPAESTPPGIDFHFDQSGEKSRTSSTQPPSGHSIQKNKLPLVNMP